MLKYFLLPILLVTSTLHADEHRLYIGTYTRGDSSSDGIYTTTFDTATGILANPVLATKADNPSFLAVHPKRPLLFACIETNDYEGKPTGAIAAYRREPSGLLTLINQQPTRGGAPCHCNIDGSGKFVLVANYLGGNAAVFPILNDGGVGEATCVINHMGSGPDSARQEAPHAHSINLSQDNRFAYVADLGIDRIMIYRFDDENGKLIPSAADSVSTVQGGGPRHFAIHPNGQFAYTNNELTCQVTAFRRSNSSGALEPLQHISTLPDGFDGRKSTAECLVHPSGEFLYVSNRGHDSIAVYSIASNSGLLKLLEIEKTGGREPRNFRITSDGKWLLAENQNTNTVNVFVVAENGMLTPTEQSISVGKPVCIRFVD